MNYTLLWFELWLAALLFVAVLVACIARRFVAGERIVLSIVVAGMPLLTCAAATLLAVA